MSECEQPGGEGHGSSGTKGVRRGGSRLVIEQEADTALQREGPECGRRPRDMGEPPLESRHLDERARHQPAISRVDNLARIRSTRRTTPPARKRNMASAKAPTAASRGLTGAGWRKQRWTWCP